MSDLLNKELEKQKFQFDTQQINAEESLQKEALRSGDAAQPMKLSKEGKWEVLQGTDTFSFMKYEQGAFDHFVRTREEEKKLSKEEKKDLRKEQEALIKKNAHSENEDFSLIKSLENNPFNVYEWLKASAAVDGASDSFKELVDAFGKMLNTHDEAVQTAYIALTIAADNYLNSHSKTPVHLYGKQRVLICNTIKERAGYWSTFVLWRRKDKNVDREEKYSQVSNQIVKTGRAAYKDAMTALNRDPKLIDKYRTNTEDILKDDSKWNEKWLDTFFELESLNKKVNEVADNPEELERLVKRAEEVKKERKPLLDELVNELMSVTEAEIDRFINDPDYCMNNLERLRYLGSIAYLIASGQNPADIDYFDEMKPFFKEKYQDKCNLIFKLNQFVKESVGLSDDSKKAVNCFDDFNAKLDEVKEAKEIAFASDEKRDQIAKEKLEALMRKDDPGFIVHNLYDAQSEVVAENFLTHIKKVYKYDSIVLGKFEVNRKYNYILHFTKPEDTDKKILSPKNMAIRKWNEKLTNNFKTLRDVGVEVFDSYKKTSKKFEDLVKNKKTELIRKKKFLGDLLDNMEEGEPNYDIDKIKEDMEEMNVIQALIEKHGSLNNDTINMEIKELEGSVDNLNIIIKEWEKEKSGIDKKGIDGLVHMSNYNKKTIERIAKEKMVDVSKDDMEMFDSAVKIYDMCQNGIKAEEAPAEKEHKAGVNTDILEKIKVAEIAREELYDQMFDTIQDMMDFDISEEKIRDINWISENYTRLQSYCCASGNISNIEDGQANFLMFKDKEFLARFNKLPNIEEVNAKLMVFSSLAGYLSEIIRYKGLVYKETALDKKEFYFKLMGTYSIDARAEEMENLKNQYNNALESAVNGYKKYLEVKKRNNG